MTSFFPDVSSKQMIKIAESLGFVFVRQSGTSHAIYKRAKDNRPTTIPKHGKKSLKRKTIKAICKDLGITIDELKTML
ncbi:MAG: type II toxin-antitoxin system HicA family toxin [Bacteroidales bacterium]|nr:type II toxin-antitoxin system HicA family toxin [Bacteroidales bacterium]